MCRREPADLAHHFTGLDDPRIVRAKAAREHSPDNANEAARIAGIDRTSYGRALKYLEKHDSNDEQPTLPVFPDEDIEVEQILDHLGKRFKQRQAHHDALRWFGIKFQNDLPIGLAVVGDPHLGSDGCNLPLLRRDVQILGETPGIHAINIGDTVDGWGGRLIHLYSENNVSKQTERLLARWFLQDSGVPWLVWLLGNHDSMDGGEFGTYLKTIKAKQLPMLDWQAKFELQFPNDRICRVDAAHNFKGVSYLNPLHGQKRASLWSGADVADIYVSGHHHVCAVTQEETDDGRVVTFARARGYKYLDQFATTHGFVNKQHGATILFVIDPTADCAPAFVRPFLDLKTGCEYLTFLRGS